MASKKQPNRTQSSQSDKGARKGMEPQGQRPEDVGEDLPDPSRKPSESGKDKRKNDGGKKATAKHKPGKM
jgi:hypothetical protein